MSGGVTSEPPIYAEGRDVFVSPRQTDQGVTLGFRLAVCESEANARIVAARCEGFKHLRAKMEELSARLKTYDGMAAYSVDDLAEELDAFLAEWPA